MIHFSVLGDKDFLQREEKEGVHCPKMVEEESITGSRQNVNENESATLADDVS